MRVKYMSVFGHSEVISTRTTENGRNTDRDALGKAIATVMPLASVPGAPHSEAAKRLIADANTIMDWIKTGDKTPEQPKPPAVTEKPAK